MRRIRTGRTDRKEDGKDEIENLQWFDHSCGIAVYYTAKQLSFDIFDVSRESISYFSSIAAKFWEDAMLKVSTIQTRSDAQTFVIFVSDGNPTLRNTEGDGNWTGYSYEGTFHRLFLREVGIDVWGYGFDSPPPNHYAFDSDTGRLWIENMMQQSYNHAKDDARNIVNSGREFYSISVFEDIPRMEQLVKYAYSGSDNGEYPDGHYHTATTADSLSEIFDSLYQTA